MSKMMKTSEHKVFKGYKGGLQRVEEPAFVPMTRDKKRQLLAAGGLALCASLFILAAPELGVISAVGSIGMGIASAITTVIAKH